ncbi:MAG: hypothetical protein CL927_15460 [Deltaproteobacteria bacterium]|nr:hypothetical protein [Deltaproteobacteria bacterium]
MTFLVALCAALSFWNLHPLHSTTTPPPACGEAATDESCEPEPEATAATPVTRETDRIYVGF